MAHLTHTRQLSQSHVYHLLTLAEAFYTGKTEQHYATTQDVAKATFKKGRCTDYTVLCAYGLMRKTERSGYYKPRREAYSFLRGELKVQQYITILPDGSFFFHGDMVGVMDILEVAPKASWIRST